MSAALAGERLDDRALGPVVAVTSVGEVQQRRPYLLKDLDLARDIYIVRASGRAGSSAAQGFVAFARERLKS